MTKNSIIPMNKKTLQKERKMASRTHFSWNCMNEWTKSRFEVVVTHTHTSTPMYTHTETRKYAHTHTYKKYTHKHKHTHEKQKKTKTNKETHKTNTSTHTQTQEHKKTVTNRPGKMSEYSHCWPAWRTFGFEKKKIWDKLTDFQLSFFYLVSKFCISG